MEYDIDYNGFDDVDGVKWKCSHPTWTACTQMSPINDFHSCKSFCHSSKYFTWRASVKDCYCKNSDSGRRQQVGKVSGRTDCQGIPVLVFFEQYILNTRIALCHLTYLHYSLQHQCQCHRCTLRKSDTLRMGNRRQVQVPGEQ